VMIRLFAVITACMMVLGLTDPGIVQVSLAATNDEIMRLIDQDASIVEVLRVEPDKGPIYRSRFRMLANGERESQRKGRGATRKEEAQIAASPAFSWAYRRSPEGTLLLLRDVNEELTRIRAGKQ
jgi:ribosomal protein L19E